MKLLKILEWRSFEDPNLTAKQGISAGKNHLGKSCYIGRAVYNRQLIPGRLMIEPTHSSSVGLYVEYALKEHLLTSNIEFYAKEPNCFYKWVPSSNGQDVTNAIQFKNDSYTFYIGRAFLQGATQVGKVLLEHRVLYFAFMGRGYSSAVYEVLLCEPIVTPLVTVSETTEPENDEFGEIKKINDQLNNEIKAKNQEIQNLNSEILQLREKLLEKIYLISELHQKLIDCGR